MVDIDPEELNKPSIDLDLKINQDVLVLMNALMKMQLMSEMMQ